MRKYIAARKNIVSFVLVLAMVITSIVCVAPITECADGTYADGGDSQLVAVEGNRYDRRSL